MFDFYHIIVIFISVFAAFFSGLLGIGGGIIVFPAFLYLMPILGFEVFTINQITGIAATQSMAGMFFAYMNHKNAGAINIQIVKAVLPAGVLGGLIGSVSAKFFSEEILLLLYLLILVKALILIFINKAESIDSTDKTTECNFEKPASTSLIIFFGTLISGALGFAGAVTFIPVLIHFCKVSVKVAISSTVLVVMIVTFVVFAGKAGAGLIQYDLIFFILAGALVGAYLGAVVNKKLSPLILRNILVVIIIIIGLRILLTLLDYL